MVPGMGRVICPHSLTYNEGATCDRPCGVCGRGTDWAWQIPPVLRVLATVVVIGTHDSHMVHMGAAVGVGMFVHMPDFLSATFSGRYTVTTLFTARLNGKSVCKITHIRALLLRCARYITNPRTLKDLWAVGTTIIPHYGRAGTG